jgi:hypothetical protein
MQISKLLLAISVVVCGTSICVVRADDTPAQAAARAALLEKMNELNQQPAQPTQPAPPAQPAQPNQPPPIMVTPSGATQVQPAMTIPAITNRPPVVSRRPSGNQPPPKSPPPPRQPVVVPPNQPMSSPGLAPIMAPPLPISPSKEAQLQALLQQYKSDQITPEQYQIERAKILAEP